MKWINFGKCYRLPLLNLQYQNLIYELENELNKEEINTIEKKEIFDKFANRYTVIPGIWTLVIEKLVFKAWRRLKLFLFLDQMRYEFIFRFMEEDKEYICHLIQASYSHFYSPNIFDISISILKEKNNCEYEMPVKENLPFQKSYYYSYKSIDPEIRLTFPQSRLEDNYRTHVEYSDRPIPQEIIKRYKKAKKFSKRLRKCARNKNHDKFVKVCFEYDDEKFAYQSIETKLRDKFNDKDLWKAYINVVKELNVKITLNIYNRYTRLFLDDNEMTEKYESLKKIIQKSADFDALPDLKNFLFENVKPKAVFITEFKNVFKNAIPQYYSLPKPYITYLLYSSNAKIRYKLFQSCKLLFLQKPTPICHQLRISKDGITEFRKQSLHIWNSELKINLLSNIFISNHLYFQFPDLRMLSINIIPKLDKCEARFIHIFQQVITFEDFKFLVSSKTQKFEYSNGGIINADENVVLIENLLQYLLQACHIRICFNEKYELLPCHTLSNLQQKAKIRYLELKSFNSLLNVDDYCNFILKNATKDAKFNIAFGNNVSHNEAARFDTAVNIFAETYLNRKSPKRFISLGLRSRWGGFKITSDVGYSMWYLASNISKFNLPKPLWQT